MHGVCSRMLTYADYLLEGLSTTIMHVMLSPPIPKKKQSQKREAKKKAKKSEEKEGLSINKMHVMMSPYLNKKIERDTGKREGMGGREGGREGRGWEEEGGSVFV